MSFLSSSQMLKGSVNLLSQNALADASAGAEDLRSPPCDVYLYSRAVMGNEGKGTMGAKHWALYFDWGYYSATYDANEQNGLLTPFCCEGKPKAPSPDVKFSVKVVKRNLRATPHAVDEKAKENRYSGKVYDLIVANCQIWARELARLLGFDLPTGQVEEVVDIGLTTVVGVGVVTTLLTTAMKNKS
ncbi:uncharacterized protein LOC135207846 [Macrobrachium nipponense]|uniref:uncharacterized protein LOC135207846 n=1 Tax=Macrobrachium nipponense TaxID=159736 RepID=UPI0030C892FD